MKEQQLSLSRSRLLGVFRRTTQPGLHLTKFCPGGNHVSLKHLGDRVAPLSTTDSHTTRCVWWSPPPPAPPASLTGWGLFHSTLWSCSKCLCYEQKKNPVSSWKTSEKYSEVWMQYVWARWESFPWCFVFCQKHWTLELCSFCSTVPKVGSWAYEGTWQRKWVLGSTFLSGLQN